MREIQLKAIPNQKLTTTLEGKTYGLHFKQAGTMIVDVTVDEETVISGLKCYPNIALIPYNYLVVDGNFFFVTENEELPSHENFGTTCKLYYLTNEEIGAL